MIKISAEKRWELLLKEWDMGPASRLVQARQYTVDYPQRFSGWLVLADALIPLARYKEAVEALRRGGALMPARLKYRLWLLWGRLYRQRQDLARAETWYRRAAHAKPSSTALTYLGGVLAIQGRFTEAKAALQRAIRHASADDPADEAHYNFALVLRAEEKYRQALPHLRKALAIDPHYRLAKDALRDVQRVMSTLRNRDLLPPPDAERARQQLRIRRKRHK